MVLSSRVKNVGESITLKLNEKALLLSERGRRIYNLTAGQLPFKPMQEFIKNIEAELNLLKSFQYGPVGGFPELRQKVLSNFESTRNISFRESGLDFDCIISNGGKHSIYNVLGSLIDPDDEVILISPYWVSYPEMIKCWGGRPVVVEGQKYNAFIPLVTDIKAAITPKTKAIIINSPNNPTGIHYPKSWMTDFAEMIEEFPDVCLLSDEIYYDLVYYDPRPVYFYQLQPELLKRTIVIDGISKSFAATGLRIGYCLAPKKIADAMGRLQGQTTSGPSSLIQRALISFDFEKLNEFLAPIKIHLRSNASVIQTKFREKGLEHVWYQATSAFYFLIDFTQAPVFKKYNDESNPGLDQASLICADLLEKYNVAIIPGTDFGAPNTGRISLVLEESVFNEALALLTKFLADE